MTKYEIYALDAYKKRIDEDLKIVEQSQLKNLDKRKLEEYIRKIKKEKPKFSKKGKVSILKLSNIVKEKNGEIFPTLDRKSTRLNSSHANISYAVFCLK